tara:strand:+ start:21598 stop:29067 length:7470 start_codon:yes stop_codon:yes gene_type:complete
MTTGIYVLNAGDAIPTGSITSGASNKGLTAPTNPTIIEFDSGGAQTNDLNCFEIWDTRGSANANTINGVSSSALNREYPISTDTLSHQTTLSTTPGYKIHSNVTLSTIISGGVLKTDNDYFVLVHSDNGNKHHFAKITEVIKYDTIGDGFEFEPRLKEDIPAGTKFAIFRGPDTTDASYNDLVAVGYGLTSTGNKHNHVVNVSRPTFYFYNDHIDNPIDNELAHSTKYEVVKSRYVSSSTTENNNICFLTTPSFGPRLLDKSPYKQTVKIVDTAYNNDISTDASKPHFTRYNTTTVETYTNDQTTWDNCFRNSSRGVYTATAPGAVSTPERSGPSTHLRFVESPEITKILENVDSVNVSKTITVAGNYTELRIHDFEKILDEKIKMNDDLKVRSVLYQQKLSNEYNVNLPGKVSTNSTTGQLEFAELGDEQDLSRLLDDGETIRIGNYIYVVASVASKSAGVQIVTIDAFKTLDAKTFTSSSTIPETISSLKALRRAWSSKKDNLMTNAQIDTELDGSGNITRNGIALTSAELDYKNLDVVSSAGDLRNYRINVDKGDKNNQYFELNYTAFNIYQYGTENRGNNIVTTNSAKYIASIINYIDGSSFIDNTIFDGTIEYIKSETNDRQIKYTISGRDDLGKLLSKVNNKKYLYSDEFVYTTQPPTSTPTYVGLTIDTSASVAMSRTSFVVNDDGSVDGSGTIYKGDLVFYNDNSSGSDNYLFLGIASADRVGDGTLSLLYETPIDINTSATISAITNYGSAKHTSDFAGGEIKLYVIRGTISAGKSLASDITKTSTPTTLKGSADKGINFLSGNKIDMADGSDVSALTGSKATGFVGKDADNSLGYSISSTHQIETDKTSPEAFKVYQSDETTLERLHTVSSMSEYEILNMEDVDGGLNRITIAPIMPVVLGRIDTNSSNNKSVTNSQGIYLVNTNGLPKGGFIHLLNSETDGGLPISFMGKLLGDDVDSATVYANYIHRFGTPIWRYIDLETGEPGAIFYNDEIANRITGASKTEIFGVDGLDLYKGDLGRVMAHATIIRIEPSGTYTVGFDNNITNTYLKEGSHETRGPMPAVGSNFNDMTIVPTELTAARDATTGAKVYERHWGLRTRPRTDDSYEVYEIDKFFFEANDPKIPNLFLFSVGDILPDSKKRLNHIGGVANRDFADYSIILRNSGESIAGQTHSKYKGSLQAKELTDDNYAAQPINSASIAPDAINRFGLIRLVELTMDWHYNAVDIENITPNDKYQKIQTTHGKKYRKNSLLYRAHDVDTLKLVGANTYGTPAISAKHLIHSSSVHKTSGDGQPDFVITASTNLRLPSNYDGVTYTSSAINSDDYIITTTATTAYTEFTSDTTNSHACGLYIECVETGDVAKVYKVFNTGGAGTALNFEVTEGSFLSDISAGMTFKLLPVEVWTSPYNANGTKFIGVISSFNSGTNTITLKANANTSNFSELDELFFCFRARDYEFNNNTVNLNKHLISGNMLKPYNMASYDGLLGATGTYNNNQIYRYNSELLPNQIVSPLNVTPNTTFAHQELEFLKDTNSIFTDPYFDMARNTSRVINDQLLDIKKFQTFAVEVNDGSVGVPQRRVANSGSEFYYGSASNNGTSSHGDSTGSKIRNNLIGVITRDYEPFKYGSGDVGKLIDAVAAAEIDNSFLSVNPNIDYTDYASEQSSLSFDGNAGLSDSITVWGALERQVILSGDGIYSLFPVSSRGVGAHEVSYLSEDLGKGAAATSMTATNNDTDGTAGLQLDYIDTSGSGGQDRRLPLAISFAYGIMTRARNQKVTNGMTFPVVGNTYPRGTLNSMFFAAYYGGAYTSSKSATTPPVIYFDHSFCNVKHEYDTHIGLTNGEADSMFHVTNNIIERNVNRTNIRGAEVFYKPVLNFTSDDINTGKIYASVDGTKRARFSVKILNTKGDTYLGDDTDNSQTTATQHNRWVHFAPNLTGYYLVSEAGTNIHTNAAVSGRVINDSTPTNIYKVISHTIKKGISSVTESSVEYEFFEHIIDIDNVSGTVGNTVSLSGYFRVMRPSQDTFYDFSPKNIDLLTLSNRYSKKSYEDACFVDVNRFNKYNDDYDTTESIYNEGLLSMYVPIEVDARLDNNYVDIRTSNEFFTSDANFNMLVTDGHNKFESNVIIDVKSSPTRITMSLSDMKKMHGCVSFGETFTIDIFNKPKIRTNRCYLGTNFHIVDEAEKVINDIIENTDITYNITSDNAKYYEAFNVQGLDSFTAANFVASLKNRKLVVDGKLISLVKDIEDKDYTNIEFNEFSPDNRVGEISRDNNLFDFYNQITVYGDGVKSTVRDSASIKKDGLKELEEVDLTIVTNEACRRRALNLLKIHSEASVAISFKVLYDQCPYLTPGQIININYPSEKIPRGDYIVLEINYEIAGYMDIKVGKYAKNLTNRIAELIVQGKRVDAALRGDRYNVVTPTNLLQEDIALRAVKLKVQYTTASSVAANVFGFTPVFGFDSTLGIMLPTGESTQTLEYDLL